MPSVSQAMNTAIIIGAVLMVMAATGVGVALQEVCDEMAAWKKAALVVGAALAVMAIVIVAGCLMYDAAWEDYRRSLGGGR